jgi:hypothetical protein
MEVKVLLLLLLLLLLLYSTYFIYSILADYTKVDYPEIIGRQ